MGKNIIGIGLKNYAAWIDRWTPAHLGFFVQAVLLLGLPTLLCFIAFQRGSRSVCVQTLAFVVGALLAASVPVERMIPTQPVLKAWIITVCFVLLNFLPAILARLLTPR